MVRLRIYLQISPSIRKGQLSRSSFSRSQLEYITTIHYSISFNGIPLYVEIMWNLCVNIRGWDVTTQELSEQFVNKGVPISILIPSPVHTKHPLGNHGLVGKFHII